MIDMIPDPLLIAYRLATLIESVVDPLGHSPVLSKESIIDQLPEVGYTIDNLNDSTVTNVDAVCNGVPLAFRELPRFVEGHVGFKFTRRVVSIARLDMVRMTICWDAKNDLMDWEPGVGPSLDGRLCRALRRGRTRVIQRRIGSNGGRPRTPNIIVYDCCAAHIRERPSRLKGR